MRVGTLITFPSASCLVPSAVTIIWVEGDSTSSPSLPNIPKVITEHVAPVSSSAYHTKHISSNGVFFYIFSQPDILCFPESCM
ncbi:hypothetical protein AYI69_g9726 [Smittium culicis]|uniref:Uncharacterized protein n=1 Tax=Smittium culicis TaxID=133412 RepID=A0A1R1XAQ7_9FUNG|nr:hypothetical protein AYI69_g9726 [Smittium culicis]